MDTKLTLTEKQKEVLKILADRNNKNNLIPLSKFNKRTINNLQLKGYINIVKTNEDFYINITDLGKFVLNKNMTMLESLLFYDNRNKNKK